MLCLGLSRRVLGRANAPLRCQTHRVNLTRSSLLRTFSTESESESVPSSKPSKDVPVRVRYAPSPTGSVHLGGLRTALYNYLLARKSKSGTFILRVEDTDQKRLVEGAVDQLLSVLKWAGIKADEGPSIGGEYGPYTQSERLPLYKSAAMDLVKKGHAYPCFCSAERLTQLRDLQTRRGIPTVYDRLCANQTAEEQLLRIEDAEKASTPYVIRMLVPPGVTNFRDAIRGRVTFANKSIDDQVLLKSDGFPTYHLAVVVDDHAMKISHVIRGEEWLGSAPKHVMLYKMFGWHLPVFAHLPLLLKPDGSKLSKRHADAAVEYYIEQGFSPEAVVNFVAFLGWNPGTTQEVFSMEELIESFSLPRIQKAGASVNLEKLKWFNQQHLRRQIDTNLPALVNTLRDAIHSAHPGVDISDEQIEKAFRTLKEHVQMQQHLVSFSHYFFSPPKFESELAKQFEQKIMANDKKGDYPVWLDLLCERIQAASFEKSGDVFAAIKSCHETLGCGQKALLSLVRYALTGQEVGPSVSDIAHSLGKETVIARLRSLERLFKSTMI